MDLHKSKVICKLDDDDVGRWTSQKLFLGTSCTGGRLLLGPAAAHSNMSHGPGTVEHWQQWWYHNHTEEAHARELAVSAEKAAGPSFMNPQGAMGRRGRPAYGGSAFPSDFEGVAAATAELPSIYPKRPVPAGNPCLLEKSTYPQTLRCVRIQPRRAPHSSTAAAASVSAAQHSSAHATVLAIADLSLIAFRMVHEGAYAPQWQNIDANRWPGTPTGRAGRGPSIDIQKNMNSTRYASNDNPGVEPTDLPMGTAAGPAPTWITSSSRGGEGIGAFGGHQRRFVSSSGAMHGTWIQDLRASQPHTAM